MPNFLDAVSSVFLSPEQAKKQQIARRNQQHLLQNLGTETEKFFSCYNHSPRSTIISGGHARFRTGVIHGILRRFAALGIPAVILHCGESSLSCGQPLAGAAVDSVSISRCDPLKGKSRDDISDLLSELGTSLFGLRPGMAIFWDIVQELMELRGIEVSLASLSQFPCRHLSREVEQLSNDGLLTGTEAISLLDRCNNVDPMDAAAAAQLLRSLNRGPLGSEAGVNCLSLDDVIHRKGIASINLIADTNIAVKELCFLVLRRLMEESNDCFLVVCEDLSVSKQSENMNALLQNPSSSVSFIFSGNDVPAQLDNCPGMLNKMISSNANTVVFTHASNVGRAFWVEYFGTYRHQEVKETRSRSKETGSIFKHTESTSIEIQKELRNVMDEEVLRQLPHNQAVISLPMERKRGIFTFPALQPK